MPARVKKPESGKVISASRRTELVAHYPDYLAQRLQEVGPERIHSVVVWTKNPTNLLEHTALRQALSGVGQVFVHWTITGLGGTFLEPNVPPTERQLALLDDLVSYLGDARRLHWRFDPLVSARRGREQAGNVDLARFDSIAEPMARAGVPVVHSSFVTIYRKVVRRLVQEGIEFEEYDASARREFLTHLSEAAAVRGMALATCCEPGFARQKCIDGELLQTIHPRGLSCRTDRARGQRELCGCTHSLDLGRYLPCPNGCLYCYAHPAG